MITRLKDYCDRCELGETEYRAIFHTDAHIPKWSTPMGEEYVQEVCHECRCDMELSADNGEIWKLSFQRRFANSKFHYAPKVKG